MTEFAECRTCEKRLYRSGRDARRTAKRIPGTHMSAYPCPNGTGWHLGHLPADVRRGALSKDEYLRRIAARAAGGGR